MLREDGLLVLGAARDGAVHKVTISEPRHEAPAGDRVSRRRYAAMLADIDRRVGEACVQLNVPIGKPDGRKYREA